MGRQGAQLALKLFPDWVDPPAGVISIPGTNEHPLPLSHDVYIEKWVEERGAFLFENWWGQEWGLNGHGFLPPAYVARFMIESWVFYLREKPRLHRIVRSERGFHYIRWRSQNYLHHEVHGFEIQEAASGERIGWAFAVERDGAFEIEDFYVRQEFRGRGFGRQLTDLIRPVIQQRQRTCRLWVPFADSKSESPATYTPMISIAQRLGLSFLPCGVTWAAYLATNETIGDGSPVPIEPLDIPPRPRCPANDLKAMVLAATVALSGAQLTDIAPRISTPMRGESRASSGDGAAFNNLRRLELIHKKNRFGLDSAETIEFESLQAQALAEAESKYPLPCLDVDERELAALKKKYKGS